MAESQQATTGLKAQYAAQVTADLDRSAKEQERIVAELATLQERLIELRNDHALLLNMHRTLSGDSRTATEHAPESGEAAVARVPRQVQAEPAPKKARIQPESAEADKAAAATWSTLVDLVRNHLGEQSEPCSAAEITAALTQAHPDRRIKDAVVRTTAEGLVAKGLVDRTKQGKSVFYTAATDHGTTG